jgi:hypothetical protein
MQTTKHENAAEIIIPKIAKIAKSNKMSFKLLKKSAAYRTQT